MIDQLLTYDEMIEILTVLQKYGIVQNGFLEGTKARKHASLRLPGINKKDPAQTAWFYDQLDYGLSWKPMSDVEIQNQEYTY